MGEAVRGDLGKQWQRVAVKLVQMKNTGNRGRCLSPDPAPPPHGNRGGRCSDEASGLARCKTGPRKWPGCRKVLAHENGGAAAGLQAMLPPLRREGINQAVFLPAAASVAP